MKRYVIKKGNKYWVGDMIGEYTYTKSLQKAAIVSEGFIPALLDGEKLVEVVLVEKGK